LADYEVRRSFPSNSPDECFQAGLEAFPDAGFTVWKTRPLAWFMVAHKEGPEGRITANFGCRPGTEVRLSLSGERYDEASLKEFARTFLRAISARVQP
jgi:hypothetical protein